MFEEHLATCEICHAELNSQKQMFLALGSAFENKEELKLPKDFAKVVAVTAESSVRGVRSGKELSNVVFIGFDFVGGYFRIEHRK